MSGGSQCLQNERGPGVGSLGGPLSTVLAVKAAPTRPILQTMTRGIGRDEVVLGIDFGTSYTSGGALIDGRIELVLDGGEPLIPTVVHFPRSGPPVVGTQAVRQRVFDPANTVSSVKRILGRPYNDPEVRVLDAGVGYRLKPGPQGMTLMTVRGEDYAPAQVGGFVLDRLRQLAEARFGTRIRRAVMTVPAGSSPAYCAALRRAAQFAQLEVTHFVAEPIAGALSLGMHSEPARRTIAICDFGGGTFDASLLTQDGYNFNSVAVSGDSFLGGDDFDDALANAVSGHVFKKARVDLHQDLVKWAELVSRSEMIKRRLSDEEEAVLSMKEAYSVAGESQNLKLLIDRKWIEPRWTPLVRRSMEVLVRVLNSAGWAPDQVTDVVLIGGTSLIPLVQRGCGKVFSRDLTVSSNAHLAVTIGATLQTRAAATVSTQVPALSR